MYTTFHYCMCFSSSNISSTPSVVLLVIASILLRLSRMNDKTYLKKIRPRILFCISSGTVSCHLLSSLSLYSNFQDIASPFQVELEVGVPCSALQRVTACCSALQRVAVTNTQILEAAEIQDIASTFQFESAVGVCCSSTYHNTLQHNPTRCDTLQSTPAHSL